MNRYFAAIDAGSNEISAVGARWSKSGDYVLEGFCRAPARGFRKGLVTDTALATDSISRVMKKLGEKTGKRIHNVYAGISSTSMRIVPSSAVVLLSKYGREVSERDVKKCVDIASVVKTPLDKEPLHRIVWGFSVDEERDIDNPLNLEGVKLGADVNVLTINTSAVRNMEKCISQAGFIPSGFVSSGLASSYRVLGDAEKKSEIALLDMGRDLSEAMIFFRGRLRSCKVFPFGVNDLISDSGTVDPDDAGKLEIGLASLPGWGKVNKVIVTRDGALNHDLIDALEGRLGRPVSAGTCIARPFEDLPHERAGYIAALGILDHLQEEQRKKKRSGRLFRRGLNRAISFIDKYF